MTGRCVDARAQREQLRTTGVDAPPGARPGDHVDEGGRSLRWSWPTGDYCEATDAARDNRQEVAVNGVPPSLVRLPIGF
jgi:hypothetical protein